MDNQKLSELLFPHVKRTPQEVLADYPPRDLPEGAAVTRFAPSPTGFVHFGSLFPVMTCERLAHRTGGVFYLRIEDTDQKREVPGGVENILKSLEEYRIFFDEGATADGDSGRYGPYRQRQRAELYHVFAKELVTMGRAYPCFCTEEELQAMRAEQERQKANFGYCGKWAKWSDASLEDILEALGEGKPWVLRFRSLGDPQKRFKFRDLVKGELELPENDQDIVLLKSDGIPTYHFAHVVDDYLMHTTHVVRGDEWLATLPVHLQLFRALGWKAPKYMHISPLMKLDGDSKRKLSKRKDPEAALTFYAQEGYPPAAVKEYIMTLLNSDYEDWRRANPDTSLEQFNFSAKKMSPSGALFDLQKLTDVSKTKIASMSAQEVFEELSGWAEKYDPQLHALLGNDPAYALAILSIGRGGRKPRKDLATWKDAKPYLDFFYRELFCPRYVYPQGMDRADLAEILRSYGDLYDPGDDQTQWFEKIKELSCRLGYCPETKVYRREPENWKGHVGDVSMVLRVAVTGRQTSPDLCQVMQILGKDEVLRRLGAALAALN